MDSAKILSNVMNNSIESLVESKNKTDVIGQLTSYSIIFYAHLGKLVFANRNALSGSWLTSIYAPADNIKKLKNDNPSSYKSFDLNFDILHDKIIKIIKDDGNDVSKFDMQYIYNEFPTLDSILDRHKLNEFISTYIYGTNLTLQW